MNLEKYQNSESSKIDFKENLEVTHPKSWLKSISAFANTKGGTLLYGIRDNDKEAVGIEDVDKVISKISELINAKIFPLPRFEIIVIKEDNKDFIEVNVGDGPNTPYYYFNDGRKTAYIRSGDQSIEAPEHILRTLILKGQNTTYDALSSKYTLNDVSFTLLDATLKKETGKQVNENRDYVSLGLLNEDGFLSNAGLLFCDQFILKQSKVFCTKWKGLIKGSLNGDTISSNLCHI